MLKIKFKRFPIDEIKIKRDILNDPFLKSDKAALQNILSEMGYLTNEEISQKWAPLS